MKKAEPLTKAMEQMRLMWKTINRSRLRNCPGGHFRCSQPAPAHNLKTLGHICRVKKKYVKQLLVIIKVLIFVLE